MTRARRKPKLVPQAIRDGIVILAGLFGLGMLGLSYSFHTSVSDLEAFLKEARALPGPHDAMVGETVVVSGNVAGSVKPLRSEFVIYQREQTQGTAPRGTEVVVLSVGRQPLLIATPQGPVSITNDDYSFDDRPLEWAPVSRTESEATFTEALVRIKGFVRESPIVVVGSLESTGETIAVRAHTIATGSRDTYIDALQQQSARLHAAVPYLLLIGPLLLAFAIWKGREIFRPS